VLRVRERAARAVQAVFEELGFPAVSEAEVAAATSGYDSRDMPDRDRAADVAAADRVLAEVIDAAELALALDRRGFGDVAEAIVGMQRQRIAADYLQTSAIVDGDGLVRSAVNDPNRYAGPGTGWRLDGERWQLLQRLPHAMAATELVSGATDGPPLLVDGGTAQVSNRSSEVVIALGPAFGTAIQQTIGGLPHRDVLEALIEGVRQGGARGRFVRVRRTSDVAFIAHDGALLSGSGIGIGLQSKGTAVIHRADLQPLDNLELFGMAPLLTLDSYHAIGMNAAGYALGRSVGPVPVQLDNFARAKLIVLTTLLHAIETTAIVVSAPAVEVAYAPPADDEQEPVAGNS
jgi:propanediol dehydratase large subunit